jgi:hypothetical protein
MEKDWHKKTVHVAGLDPAIHFPTIEPQPVFYGQDCKPTGEQILVATDDGLPVGNSFRESYGYILPQRAWSMVREALGGTEYDVERIGMLHDRSFWFMSLSLKELQKVTRQGEKIYLNISGSLAQKEKPQGEISATRAVCWNTVSLSRLTGQKLFSVKQTKNSFIRLDNAKADVEQAVGMVRVFNETMQGLEGKAVTVETARNAYVGEAIQHGAKLQRVNAQGVMVENRSTLNRIDSLVSLFQRGDGNTGQTRADVLNGFTQFFTRGGGDDSTKSPWKAIESSEFGGNGDRKAEFLATLADDASFDELVQIGASAN